MNGCLTFLYTLFSKLLFVIFFTCSTRLASPSSILFSRCANVSDNLMISYFSWCPLSSALIWPAWFLGLLPGCCPETSLFVTWDCPWLLYCDGHPAFLDNVVFRFPGFSPSLYGSTPSVGDQFLETMSLFRPHVVWLGVKKIVNTNYFCI